MEKVIEIDYKPRNWSILLHNSYKRFFSLIIHRRGGKTTALVNHLQRAALDDEREKERIRFLAPQLKEEDIKTLLRGRFYGLVFPTFTQAKTTAWDMMKYYSSTIPNVVYNESELTVKYPNGSKLRLFGSDNPDAMRGPAFWGLGFDEYSQQPPNIFSEVLSKSLADHLGFAIFAGTIKGKNQLYKTHEIAKANQNEWDYIWQDIDYSLKTEEGPTIELLKIALEDDRKLVVQGMMTQEEFDQEWYLSPTAAIKGSIYGSQMALAEKEGRIGVVPYDKALNVHTVWDLGVGKNLTIGFYQRSMGQLRKIDYWHGDGNDGIPEGIRAVKNKLYIYGKHFAPHDIQSADISTGISREKTARSLGIRFTIVPDIGVDNGIDQAKIAFSNLWIDKVKCSEWLDAITFYHDTWDEKRGMFVGIPYHDWSSHGADEFRYAAVVRDKMTNEKSFEEQYAGRPFQDRTIEIWRNE